MNEPAGCPEESRVNLAAGTRCVLSPILSSEDEAPAVTSKEAAAGTHPTSRNPHRRKQRGTLLVFFFHLSISTLSLSLSLPPYRSVFISRILIYPWTRHISCPLSSRVQPTDIYQPRDIAFGRLCRRDCLFEIPTGFLLPRIINRFRGVGPRLISYRDEKGASLYSLEY